MLGPDFKEKLRNMIGLKSAIGREFLAEFLGTFILVAFGDACVAQFVMTSETSKATGFLSVNFGWGMAVTMAVLVSGGVSGGHVNPAVTVAMAVWGKISWAKVPFYMVAQYLGAFAASVLVFAVYINALDAYDPGRTMASAGIFATYPGSMNNATGHFITNFLSSGNGFGDQIVGTMLLLICVCAITDGKNMEVPKGLIPLLVGFLVLNIGICFGFNCGYAINPARDLGPRFFTLVAGWGSEPFMATTFDGVGWWWIPIVASHIGAILGVAIYMFLIELHHPQPEDQRLKMHNREQITKPKITVYPSEDLP